MADLKVVVIGIVIFVSLLGLIILSANIHTHQIASENAIVEAKQEFLDTVTDRGAITWHDYDNLITALSATGGTFEVSVVVNRMFAIPDRSPLSPQTPTYEWDPIAGVNRPVYGFIRDYRPIHGVSTRDGSWNRLQLNPADPDSGTIFMRRHDLVTLTINQTSLMQHQTNMLRQLNMTPGLRTWTLARASRNAGNQMVDDEAAPIRVLP